MKPPVGQILAFIILTANVVLAADPNPEDRFHGANYTLQDKQAFSGLLLGGVYFYNNFNSRTNADNRSPVPEPRCTIGTGSDGTNWVKDNLTGLIWTRNANLFGTNSWSEAVINCNSLTYGGYDDWRLPNVWELQGLIDYVNRHPHPFTGVASCYWSRTTLADYTDYAWIVYLTCAGVHFDPKSFMNYAWPVRGEGKKE